MSRSLEARKLLMRSLHFVVAYQWLTQPGSCPNCKEPNTRPHGKGCITAQLIHDLESALVYCDAEISKPTPGGEVE